MASGTTEPEFGCPVCGYDVGQTLRDERKVCPECGSEISRELCERHLGAIDEIPREVRGRIYAVWLLAVAAPVIGVVLGAAWFVALMAASLAGVWWTWWWIERRIEPRRAWARAIGPALAVLMLGWVVSGMLFLAAAVAWGMG